MKLKLKQSVVADKLYVPPAVIDADVLGLSEDEAKDLIGRGIAELASDEAAPVEVDPEPASVTAPAPRSTTRTRK